MKKIYKIRHIENMIQLSKRIIRNGKTEAERRSGRKHLAQYESLLRLVQDADEIEERQML